MFKAIFLFELKHWIKQPAIYLYAALFSGMAFLILVGSAGMFDPHTKGTPILRLLNSPFEINYIFNYYNKFFLFLLPAIVGASIYRDYKHNVHQLLYSFPIRKAHYLWAKYLSATLVVFGITALVGLAYVIGEHMPGLDPNKVGPFRPEGYLQLFGVYVYLNLLFVGAIVFGVVSFTRNHYSGFGLIIGLFLFQAITENIFANSAEMIALIDPLAKNTTSYVSQFWTFMDRREKLLPVLGAVVENRLLWLGVGATIFAIFYSLFKLHEQPFYWGFKKGRGQKMLKNNFSSHAIAQLPSIAFRFDTKQQIINAFQLSFAHLKAIFKTPMFYALFGFGILTIVFMVGKMTNGMEIRILPATNVILFIPVKMYKVILMLMTFIYVGVLLHRERSAKVDQLVDSSAAPNGVLFWSKFLAIVQLQVILLIGLLIAGLVLQLYNGYFHFEFDLYAQNLLGVLLPELLIWAAISFLFHSLLKNQYIAIFLLLIFWVGTGNLEQLDIHTRLLAFNETNVPFYSALNAYGQDLRAFYTLEGYWASLSVVFIALAYLFLIRGVSNSWKDRWMKARQRFNWQIAGSMLLGLMVFTILGFKIYDQEQLDIRLEKGEQNKQLEAFIAEYGYLKGFPQPQIASVQLEVDLFPEENRMEAKGSYQLINRTERPIDTILVKNGFDEISSISLNKANEVISKNDYFQFTVLHLKSALEVGDSVQLNFEVKNQENTLFTRYSNVLNNGTFFLQDAFPRVGYMLDGEELQPTDSNATNNHAYASDSDAIKFKATVNTTIDQIAITPGKLMNKWQENDRAYFQYELAHPIKYSLGFNSANYELKTEQFKDIELSIYHHPDHAYNLEQMFNGLKTAYDYNTQIFGPYQHDEIRIIEFPHSEGSHATTYANNIPMSEIRFIANGDTSNGKTDLSFYVPAHELTHQWWGNQIVPANAKGARMISESITEYLSLRIYEKAYGKEQALNFLKNQRKRYMRGRRYKKSELPLSYVSQGQQYLFYGKGCMVMNSIAMNWGEENFNAFLNDFLQAYKFSGAPYPTSLVFIDSLKSNIPSELTYLVEDGMEKVVFYDGKIERAYKESGQYIIDLAISKTVEKDSIHLPLNDWVELGLYQDGELKELKRVKITEETQSLKLPYEFDIDRVVLDPRLLLIEKELEDNEYLIN